MNPTGAFPLSGYAPYNEKKRVYGVTNNHVYVGDPVAGKLKLQVVDPHGNVATAELDADTIASLASRLSALTHMVTKREFV